MQLKLEERLIGDNERKGLINGSDTATFFQEKSWLTLTQNHFKEKTKEFGVFEGDNLIASVPLSVKNDEISFWGTNPVIGGELVTDYGDIICLRGKEDTVWRCIVEELRKRIQGVTKYRFDFVRENSPSYQALKGLGFKEELLDVAPNIKLPESIDDYFQQLDRHDRHELKRKIRKIEDENYSELCSEGEEGDMNEFFRLMKLSSPRKEKFLTDGMENFFRDIYRTYSHKSSIKLCFLNIEGEKAAGVLYFIYRNKILLYNSGFDPKFMKLSPGLVLNSIIIRKAIENGIREYDFLRGNEKYKYSLGGKDRKLFRMSRELS